MGYVLLIPAYIVTSHHSPMPPIHGYLWWTSVYFRDLPCKIWHHISKGLVALFEIRIVGIIPLIRRYDRVVRSNLEHVFPILFWPTVDRKGIVVRVDGSPV